MNRILAFVIVSVLAVSSAHADTCGASLTGPMFNAYQSVRLCSVFGSGVNHAMIPSTDNLYDLGTASKQWKNEYISGTFISSRTTDLGWSIVAGANVACNTTCVSACVLGFNTAVSAVPVACTDATADICLCAGAS